MDPENPGLSEGTWQYHWTNDGRICDDVYMYAWPCIL
jgi:hypothetical protein